MTTGWWKQFGSAELDTLIGQSLTDSLTLQAAVARVQEAEGSAQVASAPLMPALSLSGGSSVSTRTQSLSSRELIGQASYELDFWGKNRAAAGSGRALVTASRFDAGTVAMTLSASVADGYFNILSLRERMALAQSAAKDAREQLRLIDVQRRWGTGTDLQRRQQEAALATYEAAVPALSQQIDAATHALAVLAGRAPEGFAVPDAALGDLRRPAITPDLPPRLLASRPDIQAAEARLVSANFDIGAARAAFFPTLSLSASGGLQAGSTTSFFPPSALAGAGGSLLAPLFQGGALSGQLKADRARKTELIATYRQTVFTAFQDVEDALSAVANLRKQEAIDESGVIAARAAAQLAREQYRLGGSDYLAVLTTQQTLYQAQDGLAQIRLAHLQAIVGLCRALGGGFGGADADPGTDTHDHGMTR